MITAPAIPRLTFDPGPHVYRWDGHVVPNVTRILEEAGIADYSHIPAGTREFALLRGGHVHLATAFDDEGALDESTVDPIVMPYLETWRKFRRETGFKPIEIEKRRYNETQRFAGCEDRNGYFPGRPELFVLDLKCGEFPKWVCYQLAPYASFHENPRAVIRACVQLKPPNYKLHEFPASGWWGDYQDFLCMKRVAEIRRGLR